MFLQQTKHPVYCSWLKHVCFQEVLCFLYFRATARLPSGPPLICFHSAPGSQSGGGGGTSALEKPEASAYLLLYPGTVAGRSHGQLDEAGAEQEQQQDGRDVLPHVVVEAVRSEAQHVLQVFKESGEKQEKRFICCCFSEIMVEIGAFTRRAQRIGPRGLFVPPADTLTCRSRRTKRWPRSPAPRR